MLIKHRLLQKYQLIYLRNPEKYIYIYVYINLVTASISTKIFKNENLINIGRIKVIKNYL